MNRQLAFTLARAQILLEWLHPPSEGDAEISTDEEISDDLLECLFNTKLSTHFCDFGKELGVADAKSPEDVSQVVIVFNCFLCLSFSIPDLVLQQTSILPEETWREYL
jgi:hypothetical protein